MPMADDSLTFRPAFWMLCAMLAGVVPAPSASAANPSEGPSFDCGRVTSKVNRLICADASLLALDRKLADDFAATLHQGGVDPKALQAEEDLWLKTVRNRCTDAACLSRAYSARDQAVLDLSARAASPAAFAETRPFPAPAAILASARALIGKPCGASPASPPPGFSRVKGFLPVVGRGALVAPFQSRGTRFAFLLSSPGDDISRCVVADVVVLPPRHAGERFMQCSLSVDDSHGFGLRWPGGRGQTLYWSVAPQSDRLIRAPLGVLGGVQPICQEPETGD